MRAWGRASRWAVGFAAFAVALAGCAGADAEQGSGVAGLVDATQGPDEDGKSGKGERRTDGESDAKPTTPSPEPEPPASIEVAPAKNASDVALDDQVRITADGGELTEVTVTGEDGNELEGRLSGGRAVWVAVVNQLVPGTTYEVKAVAENPDGERKTRKSSFTTVAPAKVLGTDIYPLDGMTVGVGMPIAVTFTEPVVDKGTIEQRLEVESSKPVKGSWHWYNDSTVHYRPKTYWPANTDVTLRINTKGVSNGDGAWGVKNKVKRFKIGRSVVTKVDLKKYESKVFVDGKLARTIPSTGGQAGWETRSGTKVILERRTDVVFRDEQIGAEEDYELLSPYALRVTWSGEFLHTAEWSVGNHGRANVSHGCVGMNLENSRWLWNLSKVGDPVETTGTNKPMETYGNGYGDWNMSWADWKAGSALP